jgi:hypothetical protein
LFARNEKGGYLFRTFGIAVGRNGPGGRGRGRVYGDSSYDMFLPVRRRKETPLSPTEMSGVPEGKKERNKQNQWLLICFFDITAMVHYAFVFLSQSINQLNLTDMPKNHFKSEESKIMRK